MRRGIVLFLAVILLVVTLPIAMPKSEVRADYSHVKATATDVRNALTSNGALKGIQGTDFQKFGDSISNLNMNAMFLNVDLSWFVNTAGVGTKVYTRSDGTSYYIDDVTEGGMYKVLDLEVKKYRAQGITWNFCLLMGWSNDAGVRRLMYNAQPGHYYYAWNTPDSESRAALSAIVSNLAERFSYQDTFVQNWWINNEVNVLNDKIYSMDTLNESAMINLAATSYDMLADVLAVHNPYALAYVSVTHDWNNTNEGRGMSTQKFLEAFHAAVAHKNWNIDLHAYPPQMQEQVWTKASSAYLRNDTDTITVCAANLDVITSYIKGMFGSGHRMIMSEQGFDSNYGEDEQAVMMAYTYFKAQANDMVDEVIFTAYYDTNSAGHDFYNMGICRSDGSHKPSYDVFRYLNTAEAGTRCYPYFQKLVGYVGRTLNSWGDNILYQTPPTSARLSSGNLYLPGAHQSAGSIFIGMNTSPGKSSVDIEYRWEVFDYSSGVQTVVQGWKTNAEWLRWYPTHNGNYEFYCTARIAGNPASSITAHTTLRYDGIVSADVSSAVYYEEYNQSKVDSRIWPISYGGYTFFKDSSNVVRCVNSLGAPVINEFKSDGVYTYFFQADGTAMRNRLSYHPDGSHIIYFDESGHEVFSDFAHVKQSIAGQPVSDYCFFNVYGFMYVNVLTYDKTGTKIYYANPYGVLEVNKWFRFSDNVVWADGKPATEQAGQYGFAQTDGSLLRNQYSWDWLGRFCYLQGNGVEIAY